MCIFTVDTKIGLCALQLDQLQYFSKGFAQIINLDNIKVNSNVLKLF